MMHVLLLTSTSSTPTAASDSPSVGVGGLFSGGGYGSTIGRRRTSIIRTGFGATIRDRINRCRSSIYPCAHPLSVVVICPLLFLRAQSSTATALRRRCTSTICTGHGATSNLHRQSRDAVNILACEGIDHVERHEPFGKWRMRFMMAGFSPVQLSPAVGSAIVDVLKGYNPNYRLAARDGALYLGWKNKALSTCSAWR